MSETHFGFEHRRRADEGRARARRVRFGRAEVRRDERPDVARPASRLEGLHGRGRATCAPATACSTSPAAPATWRAPSPSRSGARGLVVHTDINEAMLRRGRDRLLDEGLVAADAALRRRGAAVRDAAVRPRERRLRPAQHDAQGAGARRDGARAASPGGRLLVLEFSKVAAPLAKAYDWYSFNVLPRIGQLGRGRRRELPLPGRIDPRPSRPGRR